MVIEIIINDIVCVWQLLLMKMMKVLIVMLLTSV